MDQPSSSVSNHSVRTTACQLRASLLSRWLGKLTAWSGLLLLALLIVPILAQAQSDATGIIEGRVLNPFSGDYLNNARVTIVGTNREAMTNSSGAYRFTGVPEGSVTLRVSYTDMDEQAATVEAIAGQTVTQNFNLTSRRRYGELGDDEVVKLDKFIVASTRETDGASIAINEQRVAPNMKNVVASDEFGDVAEGNVGELIKYLPGVTIEYAAGDANGMTLRGLPSEFTPVTMDGVDIASSGGARSFTFDQFSINNAARVEVIKTPIPSMPANAIGGSLNLVSKRAFDRSRPQLSYRGFFTFTDEDYSLGKTPGPGTRETAKARPGAEFTYIAPVTENFGYTVTGMYSDQFGRERFSVPTWEYGTPGNPATGATESNPYLRGYQVRDDPRQTVRASLGVGADWRPIKGLTLSLNYQFNTYDMETNVNRMTFNTGATPTSFDADHTTGRANAGTAQHSPLWTNKYGDTHFASLKARYLFGDWRADFSAGFSKSDTNYDDLAAGYFRTAVVRINTPTVSYEDITSVRPSEIVTASGGSVVDWGDMSNYRIISGSLLPSRTATDVTTLNFDLRRDLFIAGNPAAIQVGASLNRKTRDRVEEAYLYDYLGPDGITNNADNTASVIRDDVYINRDPGHGWSPTIQWPSMMKLATLFQEHPEYFRLNEVNHIQETRSASEYIRETILAAYLQGEAKLFNNRLSLIGGVRYERTEDMGLGLLLDRNATHANAVEQAKLRYIERGSRSDISYDGFFASGNAIYAITSNLLLRAGVSQTVGRPNFGYIIPNMDVDYNNETITLRNPNLKPWTAINYDLALEYYIGRTGMVSIGAFHKDISDAHASLTYLAAGQDTLDELGLGSEYLGYDITSRFNINRATITGTEFSYRQRLTMLPSWASGVTIFANGAVLDLDGERADFTGFVEKSASWGVSYSKKRIGFRMNWNYRGKQFINNQAFAPDAIAYVLPRLTLDTNLEYRLGRNYSVFFNARNLTKNNIDRVKVSGNSPDYARLYQRNINNVKFTMGIRGTF